MLPPASARPLTEPSVVGLWGIRRALPRGRPVGLTPATKPTPSAPADLGLRFAPRVRSRTNRRRAVCTRMGATWWTASWSSPATIVLRYRHSDQGDDSKGGVGGGGPIGDRRLWIVGAPVACRATFAPLGRAFEEAFVYGDTVLRQLAPSRRAAGWRTRGSGLTWMRKGSGVREVARGYCREKPTPSSGIARYQRPNRNP